MIINDHFSELSCRPTMARHCAHWQRRLYNCGLLKMVPEANTSQRVLNLWKSFLVCRYYKWNAEQVYKKSRTI